jgi:hypothetical protein
MRVERRFLILWHHTDTDRVMNPIFGLQLSLEFFIYPTDAQLDSSKRMLKITLKFT